MPKKSFWEKEDEPKEDSTEEKLQEEITYKIETPEAQPEPTRKGRIILITKDRIILDVNGNGETVKYNELLHKNLKIGDILEL